VDAPELETRFGPAARAQLVQLVADRRVTCRDTGKRTYDRIVA
jgi:endonuclease YncB( thermonuclease family)